MNLELFIPILCVSAVYRFFPVVRYHLGIGKLRFEPPKCAFPIIWAIVLLLLGYSWTLNAHKTSNYYYHALTTFLLCMWLIIHTYHKKRAHIVLLMAIYLIKYIMYINYPHKSVYALSPLMLWLILI